MSKELVRWEKDGRRVHIFNPSSFPLALFSLVLIVTGATNMTWGREIATTLNDAPQIQPGGLSRQRAGAGAVRRRGQWVTFWLTACEDDRPNGCCHAAGLASTYCQSGSGWACNEYGVLSQPALTLLKTLV